MIFLEDVFERPVCCFQFEQIENCILEVGSSIEELIKGKVLLLSWIKKIRPLLAKIKYKFCEEWHFTEIQFLNF